MRSVSERLFAKADASEISVTWSVGCGNGDVGSVGASSWYWRIAIGSAGDINKHVAVAAANSLYFEACAHGKIQFAGDHV